MPNLDLSFAVNKEVDYRINALVTEGEETFSAASVSLISPDEGVCVVTPINGNTFTVTPQAGAAAGTVITLTGSATVNLPSGATPFPFTVSVTFQPVELLILTGTVLAERFI